MDKRALLDRLGLDREERLLLAKVLDRAEQTDRRGIPSATDFLSPQQQVLAKELLHQAGIGEQQYTLLGGYPEAERQLLFFLPDWMDAEDAEIQSPLRCLRASFRAEEQLTHRDFLGSLMGMGVAREKLGDILVGEDSADLIVLDSVAEFLQSSWESAGRAKFRVTAIEPKNLHIPAARCREVRDTVSSLRLDAVMASGFRMARGKAADLIAAGKVQVNWKPCGKADHPLSEGDTVSARGFGKMEVVTVGGLTKKGRIAVTLKQYL